jgi:predicted site-specific integrase-resolvase
MEKLLTPMEVAEILQVKPDTLRVWRSRGTGPLYCRVGRLCRYRQSSVEEFITGNGEGRQISGQAKTASTHHAMPAGENAKSGGTDGLPEV